MVHIPDVIISKPRKFAHDAFAIVAGLACIITIIHLMAGNIGPAILCGVVTAALGTIASKIKFRWVLRSGGGVYK